MSNFIDYDKYKKHYETFGLALTVTYTGINTGNLCTHAKKRKWKKPTRDQVNKTVAEMMHTYFDEK